MKELQHNRETLPYIIYKVGILFGLLELNKLNNFIFLQKYLVMYWLLMNMYEVWVVYNYEKHNGAA